MTRTFPTRFFVPAIVIALFTATGAFAQVNLTTLGTPYTQNFDTLIPSGSTTWTNNSNIPGWFHQRTGTGTTIVANNGSSNAGNLYSYGTGTATDRALGSVGSGNAAVGNLYWGVRLQNNTGATITALDVTYTGEQWRNAAQPAQTVDFSYLVGSPTVSGTLGEFQSAGVAVPALNFTSPITGGAAGALDGNLPANRVTLTFSITGLSIPNGTEVMLRWADIDHPPADHGLSIDDFAVTPQGAPPAPTLQISSPTQNEGNAGPTVFNFAVTLTAPAGPGGVSFDIATADGTAQDDNPATEDNDYVANSVIGTANIPMGSTGPYNFAVTVNGDVAIEATETFVVNVTNITNASNPGGTAQGTGTITNDDATLPFININDVTQAEGTGGPTTYTFNVTLSAPAPPGGVTFDIATADGTAQDDNPATEDNDYVPQSLTGQTIPAGQTGPFAFNVTVNGDPQFEPNETFFVNLTNVTGATTTTPGDVQGQGNIQNDDNGLMISDVTAAETNSGTTTFTFNVTLTAPAPPGGVTFDIATADGTAQDDTPATEDNDYVANSVIGASIAAGSTGPYPFAVTVNGDGVFEPNETFFVNVTNVTGASIADGQGLGTINNDDTAPILSIADAAITEGPSGTQLMTFTVTLSPASTQTVTVEYATADNSATVADNDYVAIPPTLLTFNPTETSKTFDVTINGDTNAEGNEQFFVNLTNPNGATFGGSPPDSQALGIIRMDDPRGIPAVDTPVLENFDTLAMTPIGVQTTAATTPVGWTFVETGTAANSSYFADDGGSTTGNTYSFGPDGLPDRAFGGLQSGALIPTIGAFYRNDTGVPITRLTINYIGEQWRLGTASRTDQLDFQYSLDATSLSTGTWVDVDGLDFVTPNTATTGAKDGNNVTNRTPRSATITGLNIPNGATFWIRYNDANASGADDGLSVDDFAIVANISGLLTINDVSITEGNAGTQVLSFTVSRTDPSAVPTTFNITTADNTATDADNDYEINSVVGATIPGDNVTTTYTFNVTINGDVNQEPTETFFVNISNVTNATLGDSQGVGTILADDFTFTAISAVQGSGNQSPLAGSTVTVDGIVTGIKQGGSGGFFVQTPDGDPANDGNPATSEGLFVFTAGATPPGVVIGNRVAVTGTVAEFPASANPHTVTELTGTIGVSLLAPAQTLPAAITLTAADGAPTTNLSQYERYEGMRVAATLEVNAATSGNKDEPNATGSSDGVFYGVILGVPKAFREPGIPVMDVIPAEAACPACIPRFDRNPERIRVSSTSQPGATQLNVVVGQTVSNLVGPLDYGFFEYSILPEAASVPVVTGSSTYVAVPTPLPSELTIASFNLERFYDSTDDLSNGDAILTPAAVTNRLNKASLAIRLVLKNPDVLAAVEVENLSILQALATKINADNGGSTNYVAYLEEGNDQGGIDVGFLVNAIRVSGVTVTQYGKNTTFVDPSDNSVDILHDRPPLILEATILRTDSSPFPFTVIANHLRSLNGNEEDSATGLRVREKRRIQAEDVANLIQNRQTANPAERIITVGDFNAFQFSDGMVDTINTIKGTPPPANEVVEPSADLVNPNLTNLVDLIPAGDRYSYEFDGNLQVLDHAIVNQAFFTTHKNAAFAHLDAGFPEIFRTDPNRPERISDHEAIVAYFDLNPPSALAFSAANYDVNESTTTFNVTVNRTGSTTGTVSATYTIAAGTATAGNDFTAATGTVTFLSGEASKTFAVTIVNDAVYEANQTIALSLSAPTGNATLGAQNTATITIQNDDAAPVFNIQADGNATEGNGANTFFPTTVTLTGATELTSSVMWNNQQGPAIQGGINGNYIFASGTLNFPAGNGPQSQIINLEVVSNTIYEQTKLTITGISNPVNATIGDQERVIYIVDDDPPPVYTISNVSVAEGNAGSSNATLTVTLTGETEVQSFVTWGTAPDTATAGSDYTTSGTTLTFPGGSSPQTQTINIPILGDAIDEPNERLFVNLSNPADATIGDAQGEITIVDDETTQIFVNDLTVVEGNSGTAQYNLQVTLVGATSQTVEVSWTLDAGTASCCAVDFSGPHGTMTFPPGVTTRDVGITVFGETLYEPDETALVNLHTPVNATIADSQGVLTIQNDDPVPSMIIGDINVTEGNAGTSNATFTVTLSNPSSQTVTVNYATANNTAAAPSDYTATNGTLTFLPGVLTQTFNVSITGDTLVEGTETFFVNLTNATNATINDNQAVGTITDDEGLPTLVISDVTLAEGNAGTTNFVFTVTLTGNTAQTVTVNYATANNTATAGSDYTATNGTLTFLSGVLTQQITVAVTGETALETNETFFVNLTNATNATITDNQGLGTINNDDAIGIADLTITSVRSPQNPRGGQPFTITITVTNNGPADATNVVLTDNTPPGLVLVSATASQGSCTGNPNVTCSLGTILNGANATVTLTLLPPGQGGSFANAASVTADQTDPTPVVNAPANGGAGPINVAPAAETDIGIPTLSEWALIAMALMLAAFAAMRLRA